MVALSKAKAALWLLDQIEGRHMLEVAEPLSTPGLELDTNEVRAWLTDLCLDTIAGRISDAEAALVKTPGEEVA
jgi:hypothetical protein